MRKIFGLSICCISALFVCLPATSSSQEAQHAFMRNAQNPSIQATNVNVATSAASDLVASIEPPAQNNRETGSSRLEMKNPDAFIQTIAPGSGAILGGEQIYVVKKKEPLRLVAAKLGVNWRRLARENAYSMRDVILQPGTWLRYNNRKIVPQFMSSGILVNIPDRMLYLFKDGTIINTASISVGIAKRWQTPTGDFTITGKTKDPVWNVPVSIQEEMRQKGKKVKTMVKPGKDNPLGQYALHTSMRNILLHSTNTPALIYGFNSHGCIRIYPDHLAEIFAEIGVGAKGKIIYMPVKMAVTHDGDVFLEVHDDIYKKRLDLLLEVKRLATQYQVSGRIDWERAKELIKEKNGIAEDITSLRDISRSKNTSLSSRFWD